MTCDHFERAAKALQRLHDEVAKLIDDLFEYSWASDVSMDDIRAMRYRKPLDAPFRLKSFQAVANRRVQEPFSLMAKARRKRRRYVQALRD